MSGRGSSQPFRAAARLSALCDRLSGRSEQVILRPQPGPQTTFLETDADIAIYGGAAGGGKTFGLLLTPLEFVDNPRFGAVFFRRTTKQVRNQGGLWDESMALYRSQGATPRETTLEWEFRSGATVKFAGLQYEADKYQWQGSQIALLDFDELTHFTETQFFYLLSRNRSTCGVRPRVRASTNPDADSWVATFIAWWIDQDTGQPIPERAGLIRYFARINEQLVWGDSAEEVKAQSPNPDAVECKSVTFIPAKLADNAILMAKDPTYLASLMAQPLVERERLLGGNWKVRHTAGKVFNRGWFELVPAAPAGGEECRFWDFAATEKKLKGDDPDFTAGVKIRKAAGVFYIMDCIVVQQGPAEVDRLVLNTAKQDAAAARQSATRYKVRWEKEGGASGVRDNLRLVQMLAGFDAAGARPRGDKLVRARGLAAQAIAGNVKIVEGAWNESWLSHMHGQPDLPHDDIMDGSDGAFEELSGARELGWA